MSIMRVAQDYSQALHHEYPKSRLSDVVHQTSSQQNLPPIQALLVREISQPLVTVQDEMSGRLPAVDSLPSNQQSLPPIHALLAIRDQCRLKLVQQASAGASYKLTNDTRAYRSSSIDCTEVQWSLPTSITTKAHNSYCNSVTNLPPSNKSLRSYSDTFVSTSLTEKTSPESMDKGCPSPELYGRHRLRPKVSRLQRRLTRRALEKQEKAQMTAQVKEEEEKQLLAKLTNEETEKWLKAKARRLAKNEREGGKRSNQTELIARIEECLLKDDKTGLAKKKKLSIHNGKKLNHGKELVLEAALEQLRMAEITSQSTCLCNSLSQELHIAETEKMRKKWQGVTVAELMLNKPVSPHVDV